MVQFPAKARDFSPLQSIQTGPGDHTALYSMGIESSFNGNKAISVGSWPITSILWHVASTEFSTYLLTPWSRALLEKLTDSQHFMVHYHIHKCLPPVSFLSQINPVHAPTSWRCILILSSHLKPGSSMWSLSLRSPHHNPVYASPFPHMCYMPRPSHSFQFDHPNNTGCAVQIIKILSM